MKDGHWRRDILDLDELHMFLYERRDRFDCIDLSQTALARDLEVALVTVVAAVKKLRERNVLRFVKKGQRSIITFRVVLNGDEPDEVFTPTAQNIEWE